MTAIQSGWMRGLPVQVMSDADGVQAINHGDAEALVAICSAVVAIATPGMSTSTAAATAAANGSARPRVRIAAEYEMGR